MMKTTGALVATTLLMFAVVAVEGMRKQGIAVKGRFLCGDRAPAASNSTKVRIVDIDTGPDPDDTLDEKFIDTAGQFKLSGFTRELTDIDPVLYVWTDCNDGQTVSFAGRGPIEVARIPIELIKPCHRKIKFTVPKKFIITEEPAKAEQFLDIGTVNLQSIFEDEGRECIF